MSKIKVKLANENCLPEKTHKWDAGWDLKALKDTVVPANDTKKVHTGVIIEIPPHYCGMVFPRSSLGTKYRVTLANDVGIIDSEYRGEIIVFLSNDSDTDYSIKRGDRFAQLVIVAINNSSLWPVDRLSNTNRGAGGFGSTTEVKDEPLTKEEETNIPKVDLSKQAKELAESADTDIMKKMTKADKREEAEVKRQEQIKELKSLKPAEYVRLKNSGLLFEKYPLATGNMKEDLGL